LLNVKKGIISIYAVALDTFGPKKKRENWRWDCVTAIKENCERKEKVHSLAIFTFAWESSGTVITHEQQIKALVKEKGLIGNWINCRESRGFFHDSPQKTERGEYDFWFVKIWACLWFCRDL
jgi:hypothetical protein